MNDRRVRIWIATAAGLALVALLLLASSATAGSVSLEASTAQPRAVQATGSWSSGWEPIPPGTCPVYNHGLGGDPNHYAVELWFKDTVGGLGIHRRYYGGIEDSGAQRGVHWQELTSNTIKVCRAADDLLADEVRVRVFEPPRAPDYDSGWVDINPNQTITFTHHPPGMGITATDLTVGLWFSSTAFGIHNFGYGGLAVDSLFELWGAHWDNLTNNSVQVCRHPDDPYTHTQQVRVIVIEADPAHYDSLEDLGHWQPIAPDTKFTFTHGLNWNPDLLLARGECYSPTVSGGRGGIHHWLAGGNHHWIGGWKGTNLQNLTRNTVEVYRQPDDDICPEYRVRVWKRIPHTIYLPLVVRGS